MKKLLFLLVVSLLLLGCAVAERRAYTCPDGRRVSTRLLCPSPTAPPLVTTASAKFTLEPTETPSSIPTLRLTAVPTPLYVRGVRASYVDHYDAQIEWSSDFYGNASVYYGDSSTVLNRVETDSTLNYLHSVFIDVSPGKTYHFFVKSCNATLCSRSEVKNFSSLPID
ncbi:MAG: hypothetical protein ACE5DI_03400 [Candidatus Micrarchaeia archaeon]